MEPIPRQSWAPDGKSGGWKSDGVSPRPLMRLPVRHLQVHYAGAPENPAPGNQFLSQSALTYMRNMFRWAFAEGARGDEYNFVIAGHEGILYEWSGRYRGAHCSYWNDSSIGVQLGLDVNDAPTDEMLAALDWLRHWLVEAGFLTDDHFIGPHKWFLGTQPTPDWKPRLSNFQTDCCGDAMMDRRLEWLLPYSAPVIPAPSPLWEPEDSMLFICWDSPVYPGQGAVFFFDGERFRHVKPGPYWDILVPKGAAPSDPKRLPELKWAEFGEYV